jgi:hypothetical protein
VRLSGRDEGRRGQCGRMTTWRDSRSLGVPLIPSLIPRTRQAHGSALKPPRLLRVPLRPDLPCPYHEEGRARPPARLRAGGQIPDSAAGDQHFDQEGQQPADREEKREPERDEQGNPGLIAKRAHERLRQRETWRSLPKSPSSQRRRERASVAADRSGALEPAPLYALGRFQLLGPTHRRDRPPVRGASKALPIATRCPKAGKQGSVRPGNHGDALLNALYRAFHPPWAHNRVCYACRSHAIAR